MICVNHPPLTILPALIEKGAKIVAHDPQGMREAAKLLPDSVVYVENPYEVCAGADAIILMTEWNQYRALDLKRVLATMNKPVFVDLRNVYEPDKMRAIGFEYYGNGRGHQGT